jgi:EAL domain-containing protein (putative c-di-GMP-specific phosphodiesterase class I)
LTGGRLTQAGQILVVDDDDAGRELLSEILTEAGYSVVACADGRAALDALQREPCDAVMSDVRMPDMNGLELLRAARAAHADLPVVLLTGGPSLETAIEAVESGAVQYLIKPATEATLLEAAARAVRLGKLARLKRNVLSTGNLERLSEERAALEGSFARGLATLWMAYQPIVRASDGALQAHEALLRTAEPSFADPRVFLDAAERLGRLPELGRAIRGSVAGTIGSGVLPKDVFVNLHPIDLADETLVDPLAPLSRFASRVVLEITERGGLERVDEVSARMATLRGLGYRIALDDLGAGYAGLSSFVALTPDIVKIDTSLIRGLDHDAVRQKLVGSITSVCRDLQMRVVAVGVETEGEWRAAREAGCDLIQGYLMGRPARVPAH